MKTPRRARPLAAGLLLGVLCPDGTIKKCKPGLRPFNQYSGSQAAPASIAQPALEHAMKPPAQ